MRKIQESKKLVERKQGNKPCDEIAKLVSELKTEITEDSIISWSKGNIINNV